jgi:hypothetical protein
VCFVPAHKLLTAHFSTAQIQNCIPTFQPQPNIFIEEYAEFMGRFLEQRLAKWKIGS